MGTSRYPRSGGNDDRGHHLEVVLRDDGQKTKTQLLGDLATLRQQLAVLHAARLDAESIVETVREPLVVLTPDLQGISANRAFYHMFQVTPQETQDQLLYDLGNGQWDIPVLRHLLETLLPLGFSVSDVEVTQQFPRVGPKVMLLTARRIAHGHTPARILLAIEDITERQRAAHLRQQRSDWFSETLTSIGDAVLTTNTTGAITFMNPEAERLTGWTLHDALGREVSEVLVLRNEDTRQILDNPVQRVLQEGIVMGLVNSPLLVSRDGREIPIADSGAPICGADGTLHGAVMVFRDATKRAAMERTLIHAKEAAEVADRAKSEFLSIMSHELRTPLSVIIGYTDLMREDEFGAITAEQRGVLGRVRKNASELLNLITAMLDLSRLEAGRLPLHVQQVWIPTLLEELQAETQELCARAELEVAWQAEETLPSLHTDPGKLKVMVKNLLGNAVKFTPQGRITVQAQCCEGGVEFCVADTGIGIPRDALAMIFEPFRQVEGEGSQHGTGLGLHIVKRLMELLGGTVAVESEVGKGSTFRVWVPGGRPAVIQGGAAGRKDNPGTAVTDGRQVEAYNRRT
jgi:PAS domain S-box-containing protein